VTTINQTSDDKKWRSSITAYIPSTRARTLQNIYTCIYYIGMTAAGACLMYNMYSATVCVFHTHLINYCAAVNRARNNGNNNNNNNNSRSSDVFVTIKIQY